MEEHFTPCIWSVIPDQNLENPNKTDQDFFEEEVDKISAA